MKVIMDKSRPLLVDLEKSITKKKTQKGKMEGRRRVDLLQMNDSKELNCKTLPPWSTSPQKAKP